MQNSADVFFSGFEENSGKILFFRAEMRDIIIHSFNTRKLEALHDAAFTAKYINGMKRVLAGAAQNPEVKNAEELKKDLALHIGKIGGQLRTILEDADTELQTHIATNFLDMNPQAFINLTNLLSDMEQLKIYFNRLRQAEQHES